MKTNEELQKDVQDAIKWEPLLKAAEIGVTAKDGIITLTGTVNSYSKKIEAEDAAKKVAGVKAVIEKIEVMLGSGPTISDNEIASEVLNVFDWHWGIPENKVKVKVESGWVTLDGELPWNFQKEAVKRSVSNLTGVRGVTNNINIISDSSDEIEKIDIEDAIGRNWSINTKDIVVDVSGNKVTLSGKVSSWYQKDETERIAWNAPGVQIVDNKLVIECDYSLVD
jgi:osmotically-inducible protein OsmY